MTDHEHAAANVKVSRDWYTAVPEEDDAPPPQFLGRIIVTDETFEIWTPHGTVFRAGLELLATQLCMLEPELAQFIYRNR